jgi:hypothetical protein
MNTEIQLFKRKLIWNDLRIDHQTTFDDLNDLSQCTTASKPNVWFIVNLKYIS